MRTCPRAQVSSRIEDFLTQIFSCVWEIGPVAHNVRGKLRGVIHGRIRKRQCDPQTALRAETRTGRLKSAAGLDGVGSAAEFVLAQPGSIVVIY